MMEKETKNNNAKEKKRFYKLSKDELKLIELLDNIKSESSPYLYGQDTGGHIGGAGSI